MIIDKGWIAYLLQERIAQSSYLDADVESGDVFKIRTIDLPKFLNIQDLTSSFNKSVLYKPKRKLTEVDVYYSIAEALPLYLTFHAGSFHKNANNIVDQIVEVLGTMRINKVGAFKESPVRIETDLIEAKAKIKEYDL